jgi:hypothetical protein
VIGTNDTVETVCSRAGCQAHAAWDVNWRNPRIHSIDRVKTWLACDEHRDFLRDYLAARDFPVLVTEHGTIVESVPDLTADVR